MKVLKEGIFLIYMKLMRSKTYNLLDVVNLTFWSVLPDNGTVQIGLGCKVLWFAFDQII